VLFTRITRFLAAIDTFFEVDCVFGAMRLAAFSRADGALARAKSVLAAFGGDHLSLT
jgi:hypothetical protein